MYTFLNKCHQLLLCCAGPVSVRTQLRGDDANIIIFVVDSAINTYYPQTPATQRDVGKFNLKNKKRHSSSTSACGIIHNLTKYIKWEKVENHLKNHPSRITKP